MHRVQQKWFCCFCGVLCGDVALMTKEWGMDPCAAGHSGSSCCCLRVAPHCSHRPSGTSQGDHVLTRRDHRGREEFWGLTTDAALQSHNTHNQTVFSVCFQCRQQFCSPHSDTATLKWPECVSTGSHTNSLSSCRLWVSPRDEPVTHVAAGE